MRPFYISKNKNGFYSVRFVNQQTGMMTPYKSTHTADYSEAMLIATQWLKDGIPNVQARKLKQIASNSNVGIDVQNLLTRITDSDAQFLYAELCPNIL